MKNTQGAPKLMLTTLLAGALLALSSPAIATTGREAVGMCIDSTASGARCAWSVNKKGEIDICNKSGCVHCPSATEQCNVVPKRQPQKPVFGLPVGTVVFTELGAFEITRRVEALTEEVQRDEDSFVDRILAWLLGRETAQPGEPDILK
jgi:hypothetical protein